MPEMRGDGRVFQRSGRWWVAYFVRGVEHREPAKVADRDGALRPAANGQEARRFLKARRREIEGGRFIEPEQERLTVADLVGAVLARARAKGLRSTEKLESHSKALVGFFGAHRAVDVTVDLIDRFKVERRAEGRASATVNRGLELLRQAYRLAVKQGRMSAARAPEVERLPVDNVRTGFFERAEIEALLSRVPDRDVADFVEWGFRTGMRKSEIAQLGWDMLDRAGDVWALRIPGAITKNARPRVLRLDRGTEVRAIIERRLEARRLDCPLIFHRVSKGRAGQPVKSIAGLWRRALAEANLPEGRLFHDLRRSAVRTLIRAGVDPSVAMKVSGHKTKAMLDRYNIIAEEETGAAFAKADAYLSTQPAARVVVPFPAAAAAANPDRTRTIGGLEDAESAANSFGLNTSNPRSERVRFPRASAILIGSLRAALTTRRHGSMPSRPRTCTASATSPACFHRPRGPVEFRPRSATHRARPPILRAVPAGTAILARVAPALTRRRAGRRVHRGVAGHANGERAQERFEKQAPCHFATSATPGDSGRTTRMEGGIVQVTRPSLPSMRTTNSAS